MANNYTQAAGWAAAAAVTATVGQDNREANEWYLREHGVEGAKKRAYLGSLFRVGWACYHFGWAFPFFMAGWGMMFNVIYSGTQPWVFFIGALMAGGSVYSSLLILAHTWRWQYRGLYNPKPPWWKLSRRPASLEEIHKMDGAPERSEMTLKVQKAVAYTLAFGPYVLFAVLAPIVMVAMIVGGA